MLLCMLSGFFFFSFFSSFFFLVHLSFLFLTLFSFQKRLSNQATIWNFTSSKDVFMTPTGIFPDHSASTDGKVAAITASNQIFLLDLETGKSLSNLTCIGCGGQPIITPKFLVSAGGDGLTYVVPRSGGDAIALEAGGTIALSGSVVVVTNVRKFPAAVVAFQLLGE